MNCLWAFCGQFLYNNIPKILSPKDVILLFKLTKIFVTFFVCFDSSVASSPRRQLVDVNVKNRTSRLKIP